MHEAVTDLADARAREGRRLGRPMACSSAAHAVLIALAVAGSALLGCTPRRAEAVMMITLGAGVPGPRTGGIDLDRRPSGAKQAAPPPKRPEVIPPAAPRRPRCRIRRKKPEASKPATPPKPERRLPPAVSGRRRPARKVRRGHDRRRDRRAAAWASGCRPAARPAAVRSRRPPTSAVRTTSRRSWRTMQQIVNGQSVTTHGDVTSAVHDPARRIDDRLADRAAERPRAELLRRSGASDSCARDGAPAARRRSRTAAHDTSDDLVPRARMMNVRNLLGRHRRRRAARRGRGGARRHARPRGWPGAAGPAAERHPDVPDPDTRRRAPAHGDSGLRRVQAPDPAVVGRRASTIAQVLGDDITFEARVRRHSARLTTRRFRRRPRPRRCPTTGGANWARISWSSARCGPTATSLHAELRVLDVANKRVLPSASEAYDAPAATRALYAHTMADDIHKVLAAARRRGADPHRVRLGPRRRAHGDADRSRSGSSRRSTSPTTTAPTSSAITANRSLNIAPVWSPDDRPSPTRPTRPAVPRHRDPEHLRAGGR